MFLILYNHLVILKIAIIILSPLFLSLKIVVSFIYSFQWLLNTAVCSLFQGWLLAASVTQTPPGGPCLTYSLRCLRIWVTGELSIFRICMLALWYNDWCQPELCQTSLITTSHVPFQTIGLALSFWSTAPFHIFAVWIQQYDNHFLSLKCHCCKWQK